MTHWVQYHTPNRMGYGVDEVDEYSVVTSNPRIINPKGDVVWLVGRTDDADSPIYLWGWFIVDRVEPSPDPEFQFMLVGEEGAECEPMADLTGKAWLRQLLGITGNGAFGLTEIKLRAVLDGLRAAAAEVNCPLP